MRISNDAQFNINPIEGQGPDIFWGTEVPGTGNNFSGRKLNSLYLYYSATQPRVYTRVKAAGVASDWIGLGLQAVSERFSIGDFTDGGSAIGTAQLSIGIPARAWAFRALLSDVTGFTGDTSATIQVGDGSDADRYSTGTPSVFTTATAIDLGAVSGTAIHTAATTITVTITSNSDFTSVAAGAATLTVFYLLV